MKPENLSNFSQKPRGSVEDSTTENNSLSSDSDIEDISCASGDQRRIVQGLRKTIRKNNTKINDLVAKLTIAEIHLANEKEKSNYKDDLITLTKETKDLSVKQLQSKILELENELALSKCPALIKEKEKINEYENNLSEKDKQIEKLEYELTESKAKIVKLESTIHEKDEELVEWIRKTQKCDAELESKIKSYEANISEMNKKLSKFNIGAESCQNSDKSFIFLNGTKIPSIRMVSFPDLEPFPAVFEEIASAGSWMVIQRRIDGSVSFNPKQNSYKDGFGDLGTEFWLGLEKLHKLTMSRRYELYVELVDFDDARAFARYDHFVVGRSEENYKLISLGDYSGNAGDALRSHINCAFADDWWWRSSEYECFLNGTYNGFKVKVDWDGVWWGRWNMRNGYSLKSCKMLIRPRDEKSIEVNLGPKHPET
ncbi:fibrinogen-like protein 1 [Drosophila takahashii]|uniref:fibrinogen-like protein 1 n=1 Tax=Drosophila takahashii TaxID=29030 RepID=UPI001CF8F0EF|nr:fibrinogen-like protein 1 [Drosophila takahashii]